MDYSTICKLPFGAYIQVYNDAQITNTMELRTTGGINLGPSGNIQGAHKFFSFTSGDILLCRKWTELPVPMEVIIGLEEFSNDPNDSVDRILELELEVTEEIAADDDEVVDANDNPMQDDAIEENQLRQENLHTQEMEEEQLEAVTMEPWHEPDVGEERNDLEIWMNPNRSNGGRHDEWEWRTKI